MSHEIVPPVQIPPLGDVDVNSSGLFGTTKERKEDLR